MLGSRGIWRKIKSIGKGSFGQVYLVRRNNDTSSKMFVMKEVRLAGLPPKELSAAKAEVAALKKVSPAHHQVRGLARPGRDLVHRHGVRRRQGFIRAHREAEARE